MAETPGTQSSQAVREAERELEEWLPRYARRLLGAEKRRRRVPPGQLVFVGVQHVADVRWCANQAVLSARQREPSCFMAYLRDRLIHSIELKRITTLPKRMEDWLGIGDDLTTADMERLLESSRQAESRRRPFVAQEEGGVFYVDPALSADQRAVCSQWAARMGWRMSEAHHNPTLYRAMIKERRAETYPTIRWSFPAGPYVLVGRPGGLFADFVYELRIATAEWLAMRFIRPVVLVQADLQGWLFKRTSRRVQLHILATGKTLTIRGVVDVKRATETLEIFQAVDAGEPVRPPASWKCDPARCDYFDQCRVRPK